MDNDNQLLSEYAHQGSERAFRELVRRHINMVHSAALREARGNVSLAEDITQEVFTELARCAAKLSTHPAIAGWLYTCVRRMTANIRRAEDRRQRREQEAFTMNELLGPNSNDQLWLQVRPVLDDVMHELDEKDRTAVVLRFFEDLSLKEVGAALGLSENAARMRVDRALEKLHGLLSRRDIKSTASTLAVVLVAGTALSASSALAANVATGALTAAAASHTAAFTLAKLLSPARVKIAIAGAVAVLAVAFIALHAGRPNHVEAKISPELTTPAAAPSVAGGAGQNISAPGNAVPTNSGIVPQMALQLVDAETAEPLPGAKLYLFYMFPDGRGKVVRASTDADGRLAVAVPQAPYHFLNMFVTADSHVPKVTTWGERRSMPSEYTMKLEHGVTIGGMVIDEAGNAIAGAKIEFEGPGNNMALAENIQFGPDTAAVTDANGQWSCNMIPKEYDGITLAVTDKEHAETRLSVQLKAPDANRIVVTMATGFSIKGLVQDSNGQPVKGAKIRQVQLNDERERSEMTDASGAFEFKAMKAGELMLSVQADGYAPEVKTLQVGGNVAGLQFQLGRGWVLRGRITDEEGNPVPHAFIETTRRGIDKIKWSTNANADGRFEWNSAPQEPLLYSVLAEGFSRAYAQTLQADGSEQDIKLTRSQPEKENIQITGTAVDTATGQPLDTFKVFVSECDSDWAFPLEFYVTGKDGQFALSLGAKSNHPAYRIQIEQEGYLPAVSEKFLRTNGNQKLAFKLQKGAGPSGIVLLPNGEPAVGAAVLLCTPLAGVTLDGPAQVQSGINTTTYRTQTDSAGKFSIAPAVDPQGLIIVHDEGYAEVAPADLGAATNIVLQPWGSVKGRLMSGAQPVANKRVVARNQVLHYSDTGRRFGFVTFSFETTTDDGGNFSFDKVPPGSCKVFQEQETSGVWLESHDVSVAIKEGTVTEVALGGTGRVVVGKAILNSATSSIDWGSVPVVLESKAGVVPGPRPKRQDYPTTQAYIAADERYMQSRQNQQQFSALCGRDGSFRLSDMPAGTYEMNIEIRDSRQDSVVPQDISDPKPVLGSVVREVTVPDDGNTEPLDLGTLELVPGKTAVLQLSRGCKRTPKMGRAAWAMRTSRHTHTTPFAELFLWDKKSGMMPEKIRRVVSEGMGRVVLVAIGVLALLGAGGCASGNYQKADAASESLRRASVQIDAENHAIDLALGRLDNLVNKPAPDLKPQFKQFSASVDRLIDASERAEKAATAANEKSTDYFRNWDKEMAAINFEAVREQSVSRKTQVSNEFNTVNQRYRENQAVVEPLISYLQDIRTALSTDLTRGGLEAVKPLADNAEQNARKVQGALGRLTADISASRTHISSVSMRESEAKGGIVDATQTTQERAQSSP